MNCQNCGADIQGQVKFCPKCGAKTQPPVTQPEAQPAAQQEQQLLPSVWPEWQLVRQLGSGSYGVVYEAVRTDSNVESHAAIKVISIPNDASEIDSLRSEGLDLDGTRTYFKGIVDDFVSEIQLMESLKGIQNIVSVEDYKVVEKTDRIGWDIYIRMELLTPFNTYICDKTLSEDQVIKLGMDICTALEICGQRSIIHRDIKPENIFINDFGYFKLGDFGIARKLENMTGGMSQKGTYNYMAPEVVNSSEYDSRVDIYSLGIVLYRLLNNNRLPFLDTDKQLLNPHERKNAVDRRMRGEPLPAPCNASDAMADLILRACAFDPAMRYSSATAMKEALASVASGTYTPVAAGVDRTASVRRPPNPDATAAVRRPQPEAASQANVVSQPVVDTFGDDDKKKKKEKPAKPPKDRKAKKGKKAKVIAITVLVGILALAIALAVFFFTSPAFGVSQTLLDGEHDQALSDYRAEVKDNFLQELLLDLQLGNRHQAVLADYEAGITDFDTALYEMNTLILMGFGDATPVRLSMLDMQANRIADQYESGELAYSDTIAELDKLISYGSTEASGLKDSITSAYNAADAMEKADAHYDRGDYENAIAEYTKIPESDANYQDAQDKLKQTYADYIDQTVKNAKSYNDAKNYKQAVRLVDTALDILPEDVDTSALKSAREESIASFKTHIATEVAELTGEEKWADAFALIDDSLSFLDDSFFRDLQISTENDYVDSVAEAVQECLNDNNFAGAMKKVTKALEVLPDSEGLQDLKKKVEDETPTYLHELVVIDSVRYKYSQDVFTDSFGNIYDGYHNLNNDDNSSYVVFNLNGDYSQFRCSLVAPQNTGSGRVFSVSIYLDGKLVYTLSDFTKRTGAQDISIDVTDVTKLEIRVGSNYWSSSANSIALVNATVN